MKANNSAFGKNNFDRLAAAGLIATADDGVVSKERAQQRIKDLNELAAKIIKVEAHLADLYVLQKPAQLKRLSAVTASVKKLHASPLPVGAKKHVAKCLNELISLREGVYASNSKLDRKTLALVASAKARTEVQAMAEAAAHRLEKIMTESSAADDMEELYRKAADVIKRNDEESSKVLLIKDKPFVLTRVPVIPTDDSLLGASSKLTMQGFSAEPLGDYPVLHNQIVLGINPKYLAAEAGAVSGEKMKKLVRAEAKRIIKLFAAKKKMTLHEVSETAYSAPSGGVWFWLMPARELAALAKASRGGAVKITRWGFAFKK